MLKTDEYDLEKERQGLIKIKVVTMKPLNEILIALIFSVPLALVILYGKGISFLIVIPLFLLSIPLHEGFHYIIAKILGYKPIFKLTKVSFMDGFRREHDVAISLAPIVLITALCIRLAYLYPALSNAFYLVAIINGASSANDIRHTITMLRCPKGSFVAGNFKTEVRAYKSTQ